MAKELVITFEQKDVFLTLEKLPVGHEYLLGKPYTIGDDYLLLSASDNNFKQSTMMKVERVKDKYQEVLSFSHFKIKE